MTPPKPYPYRAKRGRKTKREKSNQIKTLKMLATANDLTAWQACQYAKCGYDFALEHFRDDNYFKRMENKRKYGVDTLYYFPDPVILKSRKKIQKIIEKIDRSYHKFLRKYSKR